MTLKRITVLISGRGSNLGALIEACEQGRVHGSVTHVVSNRADAAGLEVARRRGVASAVVEHRSFAERSEFDRALGTAVERTEADLIVLAGFMRLLDPDFVQRHDGRLINIHPSLLPLYPGLHTHRRALADGVKVHGCTVHFVTAHVDVGPIIVQGAVPVLDDDDEATLAARVLAVEHRILPSAVAWYCDDRLRVDGGRVHLRGRSADTAALVAPVG